MERIWFPSAFEITLRATILRQCLQQKPEQLSDVRVISHLGACSATTETNAAYLIHNNYEYTKLLAEYSLWGPAAAFYTPHLPQLMARSKTI